MRLHAASTAALSALPDAMSDLSADPVDHAVQLVRIIVAPDLQQVACLDLRSERSGSSSTGEHRCPMTSYEGLIQLSHTICNRLSSIHFSQASCSGACL